MNTDDDDNDDIRDLNSKLYLAYLHNVLKLFPFWSIF